MSPRAYRMGRRELAVETTRQRMVEAACRLLESAAFNDFTVDAVAYAADVSRMTVYNQFGSKVGLLEAIFDWVAERGEVSRLGEAAAAPDPDLGLTLFVQASCLLWASNRAVLRRLTALAALDLDFDAVLRRREERRAGAARRLLAGLPESSEAGYGVDREVVVQRLLALTSFSTVDALMGMDGDPSAAAQLVERIVRSAIAGD
jgi:AcrR family transcriptional regulator